MSYQARPEDTGKVAGEEKKLRLALKNEGRCCSSGQEDLATVAGGTRRPGKAVDSGER